MKSTFFVGNLFFNRESVLFMGNLCFFSYEICINYGRTHAVINLIYLCNQFIYHYETIEDSFPTHLIPSLLPTHSEIPLWLSVKNRPVVEELFNS